MQPNSILVLVAHITEAEALAPVLEQYGIRPQIMGVGPGPSAYSLGRSILRSKPSWIIGAGIAGSYRPEWRAGTLVHIVQDRWADLGIDDRGTFVPDPKAKLNPRMPWDKDGWFHSWASFPRSIAPAAAKYIRALPQARAITVSTTTGSMEVMRKWQELYAPDLETMEGAGMAYAAELEGIPYLGLRAVSNRVEPRNKAGWQVSEALNALAAGLEQILKEVHG